MSLRALACGLLLALACCATVGTAQAQEAPCIATHYFYWYRWPDAHFDEPGAPGPEGHFHHFEDPRKVAWSSSAWHEQELLAMASCGVTVALPVYWGSVKPLRGLEFAREGLVAMSKARDDLLAKGTKAPALGLFFDTSTLANSVRGVAPRDGKPDLTTPAGKALFCGTIVEYFAQVPRRHWAVVQGRALVVLYVAAFAEKWDPTLGRALREAFSARFPGEGVFLVADASWGEIGQDRTTKWGAALHGPSLYPGVAQIGPGYDDSQVPGRTTGYREREDGRFYEQSWRRALLNHSELVILETWNEMHEGTEICRTKETGDRYLELTRSWAARLVARIDPPRVTAPRWPFVRQRRDESWGREAKGAERVSARYGVEPVQRVGLREVTWEDGPFSIGDEGLLARAWRPRGYLYFQVADAWRFETEGEFELELMATIQGPFGVEYDALDLEAPLHGAYRDAELVERRAGRTRFKLVRANFGNRQNGRADFRIWFQGQVTLTSITLAPR